MIGLIIEAALIFLWVWIVFKHFFLRFWPMTFTIGGHLPIATGLMIWMPILTIGTSIICFAFDVAFGLMRTLIAIWLAVFVYSVIRATFIENKLRKMSKEELDEYIARGKWM